MAASCRIIRIGSHTMANAAVCVFYIDGVEWKWRNSYIKRNYCIPLRNRSLVRKPILQYNQQFTTITPLVLLQDIMMKIWRLLISVNFSCIILGTAMRNLWTEPLDHWKMWFMEKTVLILKMIGFDISAVKAKCRCRRILSLSARGSNCGSYGV